MSIYFDGVKQYSSPDTEFDSWPKALTNYRKPLVVGGGVQNEAKNQPWDYHYLYGALSEVIYENKAWTQQEVIDYYNTFQ